MGSVLPAIAHELWIEPEKYQVHKGDEVRAEFRNGQEFVGIDMAYFERRSDRLDVVMGRKIQALNPRMASLPAISVDARKEELTTVCVRMGLVCGLR